VLELGQIGRGKCISLGNDWNEIDTAAQSLHNLNVQRLKGVTGWANEVKTSVNSQVDLLSTAWLLLLQHVRLMLIVKELDDWLP
jgi:hypothetical protein